MFHGRFLAISMMIVLLQAGIAHSQAPYTYPFTENFESGGLNDNWAPATSEGIAQLSTDQANSGSRSVFLERTQSAHSYTDPAILAAVDGIPQTGKIEVNASIYPVTLDGSNFIHVLALGGNTGNAYSCVTVAIATGSFQLEAFNFDQGFWNGGSGIVIETDQWYHIKVVVDQDADIYSVFLTVGNGSEVLVIQNGTLGAKFGSPDNNHIMSFPFVPGNSYYVDDVSVKAFTGDTPPTPTPTPMPVTLDFPACEDFETDPGPAGVFQLLGHTSGVAEWSTDQARSGTRSIHLRKDSGNSDVPRLQVNLSNAPQTGSIEVEFDTYFVTTATNFIQFGHFGNKQTQITDGYKIMTLGINPGAEFQANDGVAWLDPIGGPISPALDMWTHHRLVFDQINKLWSYWQTVDGQQELQLYDQELTADNAIAVGDEAFPWFSSIPFGSGADYYLDNFCIHVAGAGTPTPTPTPGPNAVEYWELLE